MTANYYAPAFPRLSLVVDGVEIYPLIVKEVLRTVGRKNSGALYLSDVEDYLAEATLRTLAAVKTRYKGQTRVTTFVFKRIGGSSLDLMRREARYAKRYQLAADCPNGNPPEITSSYDLEAITNNQVLYERVRGLMRDVLSPSEREVLYRIYWQAESLTTIALSLWISIAECRILHAAALKRLRENFPAGGKFLA